MLAPDPPAHLSACADGIRTAPEWAADLLIGAAIDLHGIGQETAITFLHLRRKDAPSTALMTGNIVVALISGLALLRGDADRDNAVKHWAATWPLFVGFVLRSIAGALVVAPITWIVPAPFALLAVLLNERCSEVR